VETEVHIPVLERGNWLDVVQVKVALLYLDFVGVIKGFYFPCDHIHDLCPTAGTEVLQTLGTFCEAFPEQCAANGFTQ
tara:strand:+ start:847 stop:1080 length:234 start_codon:yes stop_codon:yes gene_type:complete